MAPISAEEGSLGPMLSYLGLGSGFPASRKGGSFSFWQSGCITYRIDGDITLLYILPTQSQDTNNPTPTSPGRPQGARPGAPKV